MIKRFLQLSWREKKCVLEALMWLVVAKILVLCVPFRWIKPLLGEAMLEHYQQLLPSQVMQVERVKLAVARAAKGLPFHAQCLVIAIAEKRMLMRRHIPASLYLAVAKASSQQVLKAHAWVRSGPCYLNGSRLREAYTVVAVYT